MLLSRVRESEKAGNQLIEREIGLMLLDRSGEGKVCALIKGRRFEQ